MSVASDDLQPMWSIVPSITAIAALIVAALALFLQLRERQSQVTLRHRQQASHISGWVASVRSSNSLEYRLFVRNASDQPAYEVHAVVNVGDSQSAHTRGWCVVPPGTTVEDLVTTEVDPNTVNIELSFNDSYGHGWRRERTGTLTPLDAPTHIPVSNSCDLAAERASNSIETDSKTL